MPESTLHNAEVLEWCAAYDGPLYHAVLCDPPYHLTSITERFGKPDSAPAQFGTDGAFARTGRGFMGQEWDGGDVAFRPETWAVIANCLLPGALMFVYSGRYQHRLACALEDAGLILHSPLHWLHGNGMPKTTRLDGTTDEDSGEYTPQYTTASLKRWEGHRYGACTLKPAIEVIHVAQKPYDRPPREGIMTTGAGAFNIDACRIPLREGEGVLARKKNADRGMYSNKMKSDKVYMRGGDGHPAGRWPADFVVDVDVLPMLNAHAGREVAQYYKSVDWADELTDEYLPLMYCPKPTTDERDAGLSHLEKRVVPGEWPQDGLVPDARRGATPRANIHPTVKPLDLNTWLARLLLPPAHIKDRSLLTPFGGVASEMIGARRAGFERVDGIEMSKEYCDIGRARLAHYCPNYDEGEDEELLAEMEHIGFDFLFEEVE